MQQPGSDQGLSSSVDHDSAPAPVPESTVPPPVHDDRDADYYEAQSIKWNAARIVRLSSGRYALLSPYYEGTISLIKVGTLEEIADHIPSYDEIVTWFENHERHKPPRPKPRGTEALLADIGL